MYEPILMKIDKNTNIIKTYIFMKGGITSEVMKGHIRSLFY